MIKNHAVAYIQEILFLRVAINIIDIKFIFMDEWPLNSSPHKSNFIINGSAKYFKSIHFELN